MDGSGEEELRLEEFRQLHEHIRGFERAMTQISTVSFIGNATLLSGIGAFVVGAIQGPQDVDPAIAYLFLAPLLLLVPLLNVMTSHRRELVRMAVYLRVFHEDRVKEPMWHKALAVFAKTKAESSQDPSVWMFIANGATCCLLYIGCQIALNGWSVMSLVAPIVGLAALGWGATRFSKARHVADIEIRWRRVEHELTSAPRETGSNSPVRNLTATLLGLLLYILTLGGALLYDRQQHRQNLPPPDRSMR